MRRTDLFIFDCDGVLVDSEVLSVRAYVRAYARHGLTIMPEDVARCFGMKQADIFAKIAGDTGKDYPLAHAGDLWTEIRALLETELQPVPGIASFVASLATPKCVASSSLPERIALSLSLTGLADQFGEAVFSSSMVKHGKPAPDLFLLAASRMGVEPEACTVFEDSIFGIMAARAAGMRAIGFTGGGHVSDDHAERLREAGATEVYASWAEAEAAFGSVAA